MQVWLAQSREHDLQNGFLKQLKCDEEAKIAKDYDAGSDTNHSCRPEHPECRAPGENNESRRRNKHASHPSKRHPLQPWGAARWQSGGIKKANSQQSVN